MQYARVTPADVTYFRNLFPADRLFYPPTKHFDHDQFNGIRALPDIALQPVSEREVSQVLAYANAKHVPVTVRGNSTGLMGANVAVHHGIALDMTKMNTVVDYDPGSLTLTVQPGVRLVDIDQFLASKPFVYIPAPAMKWASIGGNAATNAGGMRAVKYGTTRDHIRGLTAVLADGTPLHFGHKTVKNSSAYDLKDLIVGSEGTLAVITELVLRLIPKPRTTWSALLTFDDLHAAINTVPKLMASGLTPTSLEFFDHTDVTLWEKYANKQFPVHTDADGYLLVSFDSSNAQAVSADMFAAAAVARANGATKAVPLPPGDPVADAVWTARADLLLAIQQSTPMMDEVDVAVPINRIPTVLDAIEHIQRTENIRMPRFGHAGDGNLHIYLCSDKYTQETFRAKTDQAIRALYKVAKKNGGEMSGEHGVGYAREPYFEDYYGKSYVALLQRVKRAFDPNLILNPGKTFPIR